MGLFERLRHRLIGEPFELLSLNDAGLRPSGDEMLGLRRAVADARDAARQAETITVGGGLVLDPDDPIFRGVSGNRLKNRDLMPLQQDRMLEIAWYLWESNPLAKRLVTLMTDLIVGEGVTVEAKDARLQEQIDLVWNHRVNQLQRRVREFHNSLEVNGELVMPVARNPVTGRPVFSFLDPYQILRVEPDPNNVLLMKQIVLKPDRLSQGGMQGETLQVIQENPETGMLEGDCFLFGINKLPNSFRGRSDFMAPADWLDLYDQFMFAQVERFQFLSAFVWDLQVAGGQETEIKAALARFPKNPKPGSVYAHNDKETLQPKSAELKGADTSEAARMLLVHIAGNFGFPLSYLGVIDSNHATIEGQNDVMMKTPSARQKEFAGFMADIVRYALEGVTGANPALYRGADPGFSVRMPEIAAKDVARIGTTINQIVQGMDTAIANETMSHRAAIVVQTGVLKHLGVEFSPADLQQEIEDEATERHAKAVAQQKELAAAAPPAPNPAPPAAVPPAPAVPQPAAA